MRKLQNFGNFLNEDAKSAATTYRYRSMQKGQLIKFTISDNTIQSGNITDIFSDGIEVKLDKPINKNGNLVYKALVKIENITEVQMMGKWYSIEDYFTKFV